MEDWLELESNENENTHDGSHDSGNANAKTEKHEKEFGGIRFIGEVIDDAEKQIG